MEVFNYIHHMLGSQHIFEKWKNEKIKIVSCARADVKKVDDHGHAYLWLLRV